MFISMNWIRDFVDLSGIEIEPLIQRFTLSTAEVEDIFYMGTDLKNVVAAKICSVEKHPDSKKLHLLKVNTGDHIYDVVCGAPNVREGMVVPFVKAGGKVADKDICVSTIAGYESHGMCCSEFELGISAEHSGLMVLPEDTALGTDIKTLYQIQDIVFEVDNKSLTNRPDLWGHYGVAREFAAMTGRKLLPLPCTDLNAYNTLPKLTIDVKHEECLRYSALKVNHVTARVSPVNMRIRLFYCGTRAINLLADLTNYVMMEVGQPMHAFDCAKVGQIEVQKFSEPFHFTTLDDTAREIDENTLMITSKGVPVAIAGIMGGRASEIEDDTDGLLLESANFEAVSIRKSSTRIGLRTDSSIRYEKTLDPEMTTQAIARFVMLLSEIDSGIEVTSSLTDQYMKRYPEIHLTFDKPYVDRYTGIDISEETILRTLHLLGFGAICESGLFRITVPSWRATKDVTMKADIIEEITRIYGYDNFEIHTTLSPLKPEKRQLANRLDNAFKDQLVDGFKLHEVDSYIWCDNRKYQEIGIEVEENIRLLNAGTPEHSVIRNSLIPSLLCNVNENKSFDDSFGLFEIARVVEGLKENGECNEQKKLGVVLYSREKDEKTLYFEAASVVNTLFNKILHALPVYAPQDTDHGWQHPINTMRISFDGTPLGAIGTLHPSISDQIDKKAAFVWFQMDMDCLTQCSARPIQYQEPSKYPGIDIDLSLVTNEDTIFADLTEAWRIPDIPLQQVTLIDMFTQDGQSSITLRFAFSSLEKTLSREEVNPFVTQILENLKRKEVFLKA